MTTKKQIEYTGSCYVGVVGPDNEPGVCRDSIQNLVGRSGDEGPIFRRATKGYEARQSHLNNWYNETKHPFMLLLDHDMIFPTDTLERLRSHKLPYVSGLYMRRTYAPMAPIWYRPYSGKWPLEPWIGEPERSRLHKLGASGWGCILLHRDVVTAVRTLLKGEWEIIEDDMDIWPYSLPAVFGALGALRTLLDERPKPSTAWPALEHHVSVLEQELKPLRVDREVVGSDIRFPFFALQAGFQLYGDPDVRCSHMLDYPLSPDDYSGVAPENLKQHAKAQRRAILEDRRRLKQQETAVWEGVL